MADWQPIETAPKDGLPLILGWDINLYQPSIGHFEGEDDTGKWGWLTEDMGFRPFQTQPSHWMPLPNSPRAAG